MNIFLLIYAISFVISLSFIVQEIRNDIEWELRYDSAYTLNLKKFLYYLLLLAIAPLSAFVFIYDWFEQNGDDINIFIFKKKEE